MAPKAPAKAASTPAFPPTPVDDRDKIDDYEEGEEEEPKKCTIRMELFAALNVWASEPEEAMARSKIGFVVDFPGEVHVEQPLEIESFAQDALSWPDTPPPSPPRRPSGAAAPANLVEESPAKAPQPSSVIPASFTIGSFVKEFERDPGYPLYHTLIHEPMVVTVYWISPSGAVKAPMASSKVDLTGLLSLETGALELTCPLEEYVKLPPPPPPPGAKKAPPAKPPPTPKMEASPVEERPALLEGASIKVKFGTNIPLLSEIDRKEGLIIEVNAVTIRKLPPKVKEFGNAQISDPFKYTCEFTIPGLSGTWWDSLTSIDAAEKAKLSVFKATSGVVEKEEVTFPKPIVIPEDKTQGPRELKALLFGKEEDPPFSCRAERELDEYGYPVMITEIQDTVKWKETVKRFLSGQGANELREKITKKEKFPGAVARYVMDESYNAISDPFFDRYRSSFKMDLTKFQEQEGLSCYAIPSQLQEYDKSSGPPIFCFPDERPPSKTAKPIEDDSGPLPAAPPKAGGKGAPSPTSEAPPIPNAWKQSGSVIFVTIKTSQPIEPMWSPPPEPELKVEDIISVRSKASNMHDTVKLATEKFKEFVQIAAHDISSLHQSVLQGEEFKQPPGAEALPTTKSRIESKAEVKRKVVQELHKSGAWQQMRDEMKSRVLKIAAEKFRLGKKNAIATGKFEFCNALYVKLMEEVHTSLGDMFLKRQRAAIPLEARDEMTEMEKKLLHLRQLADEYEYDYNYRAANNFHQERLFGETIHDPNIWFEYGCFSMHTKEKGRPRDRGKAEECFREALTLDNRHLLSLLALACLMWHRGCLTQSEVLLRTAIDLHPEEEYIPWCILSQIYQAQGQKDNVKICLKKAEMLYTIARENRNGYSTPHILLSPLLKFPFSVGYLFLRENIPCSTVLVETSILLLDLYLPKEGKQILDLECDVFSTAVDNKWAQGKAHELMHEYKEAKIWLNENLSVSKEEPMSWLLLGRAHYVNKEFAAALQAYEKYLRYQGSRCVYPYVYLDMGNCHLHLKNYPAAKKVFLKLCSIGPTTSSWLGAGISLFRMCDFKQAEIALVEGNHIDSKNQKVWAYLTLTCLANDRCEEAEVAYEQLQKTSLTDAPLLLEIADGFAKVGNLQDAEAVILAAMKEGGGVRARFKLADLYLQQGKLECARLEYKNILELDDITCGERSMAEDKQRNIQSQFFFSTQLTSDSPVTI